MLRIKHARREQTIEGADGVTLTLADSGFYWTASFGGGGFDISPARPGQAPGQRGGDPDPGSCDGGQAGGGRGALVGRNMEVARWQLTIRRLRRRSPRKSATP